MAGFIFGSKELSQTNSQQQPKQLTSPIVEGDIDSLTESTYIQNGFTWVKYYYAEPDQNFMFFAQSLPQNYQTPSSQTQLILQKINSTYLNESSYIIITSLAGTESFEPDITKTTAVLCKLLTIIPVECSLGQQQDNPQQPAQQVTTQKVSAPSWDGFDYCKCLGSQDCYFWRNLCKLDVNEGSDQYLKSEACYRYDFVYVQLFNPPKTCKTDSDGSLARAEATRPYWCAQDWAKKELYVCSPEYGTKPPIPPYNPECSECEKDECLDNNTLRQCDDGINVDGCMNWKEYRCSPGLSCKIQIYNDKGIAVCR